MRPSIRRRAGGALAALGLVALPLLAAGSAAQADEGRQRSSGRAVASRSSSPPASSSRSTARAARTAPRSSRGSSPRASRATRGSARAGRAPVARGTARAGRVPVARGSARYGRSGSLGSWWPYHHGGSYASPYVSWWLGWPWPSSWAYWAFWDVPRPYSPVAYPGLYAAVRGDEPGAVETRIRPKDARVEVDGRYVGEARDYAGRWDELWLDTGDHEIVFSAPGYMTLRQHVWVPPAGRVRIEQRLERGEGTDPRSTGAPPAATAHRREARSGPTDPPGPGEPTLRRGLLRLDVSPPDAAVYLDGRFLARAGELARLHGALPVAAGAHRVEIVRPGYDSRTVDVDVGDGAEPVEVQIELQRLSGR